MFRSNKASHERRRERRLRMGCKAKIRSLITGETHYGECVDLSVDGVAIRSSFVPQHGERLMILVVAPMVSGKLGKQFEAEVEVRRCNEIHHGKLYEIGARIIKRK